MPFEVVTERGENILLDVEYQPPASKADPFTLVITNRALFLPRKKTFAMRDPWYFERVPLSEVRELRVQRLRPFWMYVLALLMIVAGGYTTWAMFFGEQRGLTIWPLVVLLGGLALPFMVRGRVALVVTMREGEFRWKAPPVMPGAPRERVKQLFDDIVGAARTAGVLVFDERNAAG